MYPDTATQRLLARIKASPAIRLWVGARSLDECWPVAVRGDWMVWLIRVAGTDEQRRAIIPAVADYNEAIEAIEAIETTKNYTATRAPARSTLADAIRAIYPTCPIEVPDDLR
jgi:hypothetical protein